MRHPYCDRKAIGCAAKGHGQRAADEKEQRRRSIFVCWSSQHKTARGHGFIVSVDVLYISVRVEREG